jgi:hypothetical protein
VGPQESCKPSGTVEEAKLATEKLAAKLAPFEVNILPDVVFHDTWNQNVLMYVEDIGAPSQQLDPGKELSKPTQLGSSHSFAGW